MEKKSLLSDFFTKSKNQYFKVLGMVVILSFFAQVLIQYFIYKQTYNAHVINIAGRQRMLSQRIARYALLVTNEYNEDDIQELKLALQTFHESHSDLNHGNSERNISLPINAQVKAKYDELDPIVDRIVLSADCIIKKCSNTPLELKKLNKNVDLFLTRMNEIVFLTSKISSWKTRFLAAIEIFFFISILSLILMELFLILKPLAENLKKLIKNHDETLSLLKGIEENASYALITTNTEGLLTSFNKSAEEMFGYTSDELVGKKTPAIFHDMDEVIARNKEFSKKFGHPLKLGFETFTYHSTVGLKNQFEWTFIRKDGSKFPALLSISNLIDENGEKYGFLGIAEDLTERKEIDLDRIHKVEQMEKAQKLAKVGSWNFDVPSGKITWSKQMFDIFPNDYEDGEPSFENHRSTIHSEDVEFWESTVQRCLSDGNPYIMTFRTHRKNNLNETVWIEAKGEGIKDENGKVVSLSGTCQDITNKVELENQLESERIKLIQSSKLATLGEMAAGVAHEINNPVAIISGAVNVMAREDISQQIREKSCEKANRSVERILKIVHGLRKFSRTTTEINLKKVKLANIIEECLILSETKSKRHDVKVINKVGTDLEIIVDDIQIEQVLINLIGNAIDANTHGPAPWVELSFETNDKYLSLIVRDSGTGISKENLSKLFDPFFTTKPVGSGTGLGLSISKGIAQEHGGDLEYKLIDGHTAFVLKLPMTKEDQSVA